MLFWSLHDLGHEFFQALVISEDSEAVSEEVLPPLPDGGGNGAQFPDIGGSSEHFLTEGFTKKCNGVALL